MAQMLASISERGPIEWHKHVAATWSVPLSGLLNLEHPKAIEAGTVDRRESIEIYTYSITHPTKGIFLIDSGMSENFVQPDANKDVSFIVKMAMNIEALAVRKTTASLDYDLGGIEGIFLTHIHMDHIMGLRDLDQSVSVYIGPDDVTLSGFMNAFTQGTTDRLLGNVTSLQEWQFGESGILDVFGDGSLFAIRVPGHTPGSTAYLAQTTSGLQLMLGDATHTKWGWEHGVEPGTFSENAPQSVTSLAKLMNLAAQLPTARVHPGHQSL